MAKLGGAFETPLHNDARDGFSWLQKIRFVRRGKSLGHSFQKALVAQRLEQGTHNPLVLGSNPGGRTKQKEGF